MAASAYRALLERAAGKGGLLAVEDKVGERMATLQEDVALCEKQLERAREDAAKAGLALPAATAAAGPSFVPFQLNLSTFEG